MDHVVDIITSHNHPVVLVGSSAQRWMGSAGCLSTVCDLLIKDSALQSISTALVQSGHWRREPSELDKSGADCSLERTKIEDENEYAYLCLWSESTYRINVDDCPLIEVPDFYPWYQCLIEEKWHPCLGTDREDGWWYGPRLIASTKQPNLPEQAVAPPTVHPKLPRGKSPSNPHPIFVPSLPVYMDALVYHKTHYRKSKEELAFVAGWILSNLVRYLYLELPHQQLPLLMEMEEDGYMEGYLNNYKRKPFFVYGTVEGVFVSQQVRLWDPSSYPEWCRAKCPALQKAALMAEGKL
jgi:hypothetical protein